MLDARYRIGDASSIYSPALLFFKELIEHNLRRMLEIAGKPDRLRPHAKTHKTRQIARMELALGITKHKCATLAEAEMLADCGAADVLLAYPLVGPNCGRMAKLAERYPATRFSVLADHAVQVEHLSAALQSTDRIVDVLADLDVGQHRTGVAPGPVAVELYERISRTHGLRPGGLHVYDGHNVQADPAERQSAVDQLLGPVLELRDRLLKKGLPVPRLVCGGTPTFPVYARKELPGLECAPGTCVLHDHGYGSKFPDMGFIPAALLLTRVISRPAANRVTFDLGYKAVASDPPAGSRLTLLNLPDAKAVLHNEEHLVIELPTAAVADRFKPGDETLAMPTHICPTCAMHREAHVIENGRLVDRWEIVARDRRLSV